MHISELINGEETVIMIGFANTMDWSGIKTQMAQAERLGVATMIISPGSEPNWLGAVLYGAGDHAALHGRSFHDGERVVFSPSDDLMRIMGVEDGTRMRNCVILLHQGKVITSWVAKDRSGESVHDWTDIQRAISLS